MANCKIPCYVLEDGTRVLSGRQIQTALKLTDDMPSSQSAGSRLQRYLNQKSLHPYLYKNEDENKKNNNNTDNSQNIKVDDDKQQATPICLFLCY